MALKDLIIKSEIRCVDCYIEEGKREKAEFIYNGDSCCQRHFREKANYYINKFPLTD